MTEYGYRGGVALLTHEQVEAVDDRLFRGAVRRSPPEPYPGLPDDEQDVPALSWTSTRVGDVLVGVDDYPMSPAMLDDLAHGTGEPYTGINPAYLVVRHARLDTIGAVAVLAENVPTVHIHLPRYRITVICDHLFTSLTTAIAVAELVAAEHG